MGKYSEYKTINLPWLAKIPANWELIRNKQFLREKKDIVGDLSNQFTLLSLTLRGVIKRDLSEKKGKLPGSFDTYKIISPGDIIFCLFDMDETPRTVGLSEYDGMLTGAYTVFQVNGINPQFLYYYYLSLDNIKALRPLYTGLRKTIKTDTFLALKLPVPPRAEQDQIVRFLDWKVSEINKLIGIRRKEIQELEEYRAVKLAFTTHYGVNKSRKIKDSGYSWIGGVPDDWHVRAFSKVAVVKSNLVQPENYMDEMQVSPASIEKNTGKIIQTQTVRESGIISGNHRFYKGQILYSKVRPLLNKVTIAPFDGLCSADMYPIETTLDTKYFVYFMLSQNFLGQLSMSGNRVKMPKINQDELFSILILFPDIKEQEHIVTKLDQLFALVDDQIERIKQDISLLQELKSVVISNTVTGKIDVRNIPIPAYEHVDDMVADDGEGNDEETGIPGEED